MSPSGGLTKRGLCVAILAVVMLAMATTLVLAETDVSAVGAPGIVKPVVSIQVPLLTKSVTLDGKLTAPDEWADTIEYDLTVRCISNNCGNAPVTSLPGKVRFKHDNMWLYSFFEIDYRPPQDASPSWVGSQFDYYWGTSGVEYSHWNFYWTCPGLCFGEGWYDPSTGKLGRDDQSSVSPMPVVSGYGAYVGTRYTFEFQILLKPNRPNLWTLVPGQTYGVPGGDGLMFIYFAPRCVPVGSACGTYATGQPTQWEYGQSVTLSLLTAAIVPNTVSSATTSTSSTTQGGTSQTSTVFSTISSNVQVVSQAPFGTPLLLLLVPIVAVASVIIVMRRRRVAAATVTLTKPGAPKLSKEPYISTGYGDLDRMLAGGLPEGYAVAFISQSYDERDLLVRKIIQSSLNSGRPTFYMSNDIARTRDLATRFTQNFFALSPVAEKIQSSGPELLNLLKIPDVGDLSNLNISAHEIIQAKSGGARNKMIVIDLLSDLLLRNKSLTTRRWLADFIGRRKAEGFTIIATLDPSIAPKEDVQAIVGVFDGLIQFFEKELQERARRFLVIKKMYGREYSDSELMLDRQALT